MTPIAEALQTATQHQQANRIPQAQKVYQQILAKQPYQPDALHGLGVLAQQVGQYQAAEKLFGTALRVQPNSLKVWFSLGNLRQVQGQLPEATEAYQKALALAPQAVPIYNNLGYTLQLQEKLDEAIACYRKALELQPGCVEVEANLGNVFNDRGLLSPEEKVRYATLNHDLGVGRQKAGDAKTAVAYFKASLDLQPDLAIAHYHLGTLQQEDGKIEDAIESYQKALELSPNPQETYCQLARQKLTRLVRGQNRTGAKLKVAVVSQPFVMTRFPNPADSIGILTYEFVRRLASDCEVVVYVPGKVAEETVHEGIRYKYIPIGVDNSCQEFLKKIPGLYNIQRPDFAASWYYLGYILQVAKDLKQQGIEVVHIHNLSQFAPVIRGMNPEIKIALHMHCEWLKQLDFKTLERRLRHVDLILGTSEYITDAIRSRFPQFADRCGSVYNGVNIDRFLDLSIQPQHQKPTKKQKRTTHLKQLLYVGRISPEKGTHVLLEAFQKVLDRCPGTKLELVGGISALPYEYLVALSDDSKVAELSRFYQEEGGWKSHLRQYTASGDDRISFVGLVPPTQLSQYYQQADIFVFPSVCHEAFGMPIAEAMVAGVPVVATRGGAFPELVEDGKTGLLVERGDADAMADAIVQLLENDELRQSMGNAGCQRAVEEFSFEKVAGDLLHQYETLKTLKCAH